MFRYWSRGHPGRCLPEPGDPQRCCTRRRSPL